MSNRYKGGVISATPPTTTGGNDGVASGAWTLEQQMQLQAAGLWPNQPVYYVEDVFSTYLYTGNSSAQTITNGINLAGKGGMVWLKSRTSASVHNLWDTVRAPYYYLQSNDSVAQQSAGSSNALTAYNSNGFTVTGGSNAWNGSPNTYVSWTFREQAKFFDVVTYTGNGTAGRTVAHNLGSVPGCIIVKAYSVDTGDFWGVYHRSLGATKAIFLSATNAAATSSTYWNNTEPTSTNFTVGDWSGVNQNGTSYVAYIYAHDAGGFGLTGTDNVISCGTFTADVNGNVSVTLGYEPQWVMVKRTSGVGDWLMFDTMRGMPTAAASGVFSATLLANTAVVEDAAGGTIGVNATGFNSLNGYLASNNAYIYIAIRRGPMQVPTVGTSVFAPTTTATAASPGATATTNFPVDLSIYALRDLAGLNSIFFDKLRGTKSTSSVRLVSSGTAAEASSGSNGIGVQSNTTVTENWTGATGYTNILWNFRRAPSFFDEVCYSTTIQGTQAINHNLSVAPELMIIKKRSSSGTSWIVYSAFLGAGSTAYLWLNQNYQAGWFGGGVYWANTSPTTTQFTVGGDNAVTGYSETYVAYLFATCAGVSKVGSYTGNGSSQTIACGFTAGSRFVLIKRTDSTGDWYVWDSARGIVAGNDPHLSLNTTAAEVTTDDSVDTDNSGFIVNQDAATNINVTSATYIFLAIA